MEKIINKFLLEYRNKNKKRFDLQSLEKYIMANYKEEEKRRDSERSEQVHNS